MIWPLTQDRALWGVVVSMGGEDYKEELENRAAIGAAMLGLSGRTMQLDLRLQNSRIPQGLRTGFSVPPSAERTQGFLVGCTATPWLCVLFSSPPWIVCFYPYSTVPTSRREDLIGLVHHVFCVWAELFIPDDLTGHWLRWNDSLGSGDNPRSNQLVDGMEVGRGTGSQGKPQSHSSGNRLGLLLQQRLWVGQFPSERAPGPGQGSYCSVTK